MDGGGGEPAEHNTTRVATLYDAVAGRVNRTGFIKDTRPVNDEDAARHAANQIPPEEVLFRRKGAPVRYAEQDVYDADRFLTENHRLPESDLLKAIHEYTSHFYHRATSDRGRLDFGSLDETALLAMGILLEEASAEALGPTGDLALVEPPEQLQQPDRKTRVTLDNKRRVVTHMSGARKVKREET